jgi:hypothetical protein
MKLFSSIFAGVGLVMLSVSGYLFYQENEFLQHAQVGSGTVIALGRSTSSKGGVTYYPVVSYRTSNGTVEEFSSLVSSNPAAYDVGEKVEVYYDPNRPQSAEIRGFFTQWFVVLIFGGLGLVFTSIGVGIGVSLLNTKRKDQWLTQNGRRIEALIQSVELNTSYQVSGKSPFVIYGQWLNPQTKQVHVFKSHSIWYDPSSYLSGNTIQVFIDERNPKRYYVDTTFLPELSH